MSRRRKPQKKEEMEAQTERGTGSGAETEKLLKKRVKRGRNEYLMQWKHSSGKSNSWLNEETLLEDYPRLVQDFDESLEKGTKRYKPTETDSEEEENESPGNRGQGKGKGKARVKKPRAEDKGKEGEEGLTSGRQATQRKSGLEKGLEPEAILGATDRIGNDIYFLVKWKDSEEADLVPANVMNRKWPRIVIQFYEDRMVWPQIAGGLSK